MIALARDHIEGPGASQLRALVTRSHAYSHAQADWNRRPPGPCDDLGVARDGRCPDARALAQPRCRNRLLHRGGPRLGAARDAVDQLDVAPRCADAGRLITRGPECRTAAPAHSASVAVRR